MVGITSITPVATVGVMPITPSCAALIAPVVTVGVAPIAPVATVGVMPIATVAPHPFAALHPTTAGASRPPAGPPPGPAPPGPPCAMALSGVRASAAIATERVRKPFMINLPSNCSGNRRVRRVVPAPLVVQPWLPSEPKARISAFNRRRK